MQAGTVVNVKWMEGWYVGTVRCVKNGKTTVDYNDGDVSEHNFKTEEYKVLALPNQPFSFTTLCDIAPSYLTCPICLEILDKPQTLKTCMHTFCYVCITRINNCATCGLPFQESDVASNPIITTLCFGLYGLEVIIEVMSHI